MFSRHSSRPGLYLSRRLLVNKRFSLRAQDRRHEEAALRHPQHQTVARGAPQRQLGFLHVLADRLGDLAQQWWLQRISVEQRRVRGWSIEEAAQRLGVDEGTWGAWERGTTVPWPRYARLLERFLAGSHH